ncbi:hypothetical protein [Halopelagius fulvigenes]|uniref:Uncharacterized protein n=1 Tax=Halopelagius fulvigenes TaxID=1198324 RepID=A0ABD5U165_9EURY
MSIRVRFDQVDGLPIERMVTMDSLPAYDLPAGIGAGYRCWQCEQSDEEIAEIDHLDHCPLTEKFDYEAHEPSTDVFREAIKADHEFVILQAGEVNKAHGYIQGTVVHFWCCECFAGDETLSQIEHSEVCSLARHNLGIEKGRATDGGRRHVRTDGGCKD